MAYIGLDIGHGNNTFPPSKGVYKNGVGYAEHDFNSKLAIRIKELLESHGHKVILGQQPFSKEVPLRQRTNLYNRENVDLVISIHANAGVANASGRCAFYWHTSERGKKLAQSIINEIKALGYTTHGNGLHASKVGSWTNLHITRETKMPAVLVEHGFMTNDYDFEFIFGSKQDEYIEAMAQADVKGILNYLGEDFDEGKVKAQASSKKTSEIKPSTPNKSISQMADEVIAGKHGSGHANRQKSLGVDNATYQKVRAEVNRRAGIKTTSKKANPKKSIDQMAKEVIDGKHGNGHEARRKSLGISQSEYQKVRNKVNQLAGGKTTFSKSIKQMADEVIAGKHGNGHAQRQKSLGVDNATYQKVRAEVNRRS